jgi:hypothetical protein
MEYRDARKVLESLAASQKGRFLEERDDMEIPTFPEFMGEMNGRAVSLSLEDGVEFRLWIGLRSEAPFKIKFADHVLATIEKMAGIVVDLNVGDEMIDSKYVIDGIWVEEKEEGVSVSQMTEEVLKQVLEGLGFKDAILRMGFPDGITVEKRGLTVYAGSPQIEDENRLMEFIKEAIGLADKIDAFLERARKEGLWEDGRP